METNRIQKTILLKAPRSRVWEAITDSKQFGLWFGMSLNGPFEPSSKITGAISPTTVDPEVAKLQEAHAGKAVEFMVERIEPRTLFSIKWHPFAIDPEIDYSKEPMTLVEFRLEDRDGGTFLTITESGFENIPISRRAEAIKSNDGGWAHQARLLEKYLEMNGS